VTAGSPDGPLQVAGQVLTSRRVGAYHHLTLVAPSMIRAAALASGTPVAFATNGTVRDARGLASST
jgi:hypothetical protein